MVAKAGLGAIVALGVLVGGCLAPGDGQGPEAADGVPAFALDWAERALPNGDGHDHYVRTQHVGFTTPNFQVVGWDPLVTDHHGRTAGGYFCGDVATTDERTLAVVESFTSDVAFVLIDVTDPASPSKVGELVMEQTQIWDIAMSPDQRYVLLATSPLGNIDEEPSPPPPPAAAAPSMSFRDACTGLVTPVQAGPEASLPYHSGVVLVDITQPREPVVRDFRPLPYLGGHSIVAQDVDGETVVLVTVTNLPTLTNYYVFYGILPTPTDAVLDTKSVYTTDAEGLPADYDPLMGNHDGYLRVHPVTGEHLAFLADGNWGVTILNIDDLRMPKVVGRWDQAESIANPGWSHFAHSILPLDTTWEGRHYTFVSEECGGRMAETPTCLVYSLDTTDPTTPTLVGAWTLPHDVGEWVYPWFSPHYMAVIDRTLFIAHWHAGVWAVDVSTPEAMVSMPTIGVFDPDHEVPFVDSQGYGSEYNLAPVIADIVAIVESADSTGRGGTSGSSSATDGRLLVFDGTSGVYVVSFDAAMAAPTPPAWPLHVGTD